MAVVESDVLVPGTADEVAARWLDTARWPRWMGEVEELLEVSADWPQAGSTVRWRSAPSGRGEVTETVVEYVPGETQINDITDPQLTGRQTVTFTPDDDEVLVGLRFEYRLSKRGPLTPILERLFVRAPMRIALTTTLERFSGHLADP